MKLFEQEFPLEIRISFSKFFEQYQLLAESPNDWVRDRALKILKIAEEYPELDSGITTRDRLKELQPQIDLILEDAFAQVLQLNEIKAATIPFDNTIIKATRRYQNILAAAGEDFVPKIKNLDDDHYYIMGCSIILGKYYDYKIDFRRPFYFEIPDENGALRYYRIMYNADFIEISKSDNVKDITAEDVAELLDSFDNIEIWKEKFPPGSYIFKGIGIANMYDATTDISISNFKTNLLKYDESAEDFVEDFENVLKTIFNLEELHIGFTSFNKEEGMLEKVSDTIPSFTLFQNSNSPCTSSLCEGSYQALFKKGTYFPISDVNKFQKLMPDQAMYTNLLAQKAQSAILAPVISNDQFLGIVEIVSPRVHELNSINANKLLDIMPYLVERVAQDKIKKEDEIELVIQEECTSIHPSVYWKFRQEAKKFIFAKSEGKTPAFGEMVFENVYPLFGQIDIKGSSEARNEAIKKDLLLQLNAVTKILKKVMKRTNSLPIYDQLLYIADQFIEILQNQLEVDSEQKILSFIRKEIKPLFKHLKALDPTIESMIGAYQELLDPGMNMVYKHRKAYDESVMMVNKNMADILDEKQKEAQEMYPHYFERFKTDGVEHNMYIGEAITKKNSFHKIYLYNLRLWQLQVMCEMENEFYLLQKELPAALEVASMVLAFNSSLSVRFRMDEKRFDVDGTYNARYEVVKKRVDKAFIKGTQQRITEKGKLVIVYSQRADEQEYKRYLKFLQSKNYLEEGIEILELEDLQGVTGLKALRVNILYNKNKNSQEFYTYDDLMKEINA